MTVAIVTAAFGGYDVIRTQAAQTIPVAWVAVVDDPDIPVPEPWTKRCVEPSSDPRLAAKVYKMKPWDLLDHERIVWVDANTEVTSPDFANEAVASIRDGVAMFKHPRRDCIYEECEASLGAEAQAGKYDGQPLREQVAHYRAEGHPDHAGLYACGTIAWDATDARAREFGTSWLAECERWSVQDQLSAPVVARRVGITPGVFPHPQLERRWRGPDYLGNRWLRIHPHA